MHRVYGGGAARGRRLPQGGPDDWKWPPNRNDHWGIAKRDNAKLAASGGAFPFRAPAGVARPAAARV